jgi:hypothetical protein
MWKPESAFVAGGRPWSSSQQVRGRAIRNRREQGQTCTQDLLDPPGLIALAFHCLGPAGEVASLVMDLSIYLAWEFQQLKADPGDLMCCTMSRRWPAGRGQSVWTTTHLLLHFWCYSLPWRALTLPSQKQREGNQSLLNPGGMRWSLCKADQWFCEEGNISSLLQVHFLGFLLFSERF